MINVHKSKVDAMQKILNYVSRGYVFYTSSSVLKAKWDGFATKMVKLYEVDRTTQQRYRAKDKGHSNVVLVAFTSKKDTHVHFVMLATAGNENDAIFVCEKMHDVTNKQTRLTLSGYELLKLSRKGSEKPRLTWRMTRETMDGWKSRIKGAVRSKSRDAIAQCIWSLERVAGFHAARQQAFELSRLLENELKRQYKPTEARAFKRVYTPFRGRFRASAMLASSKVSAFK